MWVAIAAITGWAVITLYRMYIASKAREQVHRERLAMIERGLVPPPEADPEKFERMIAHPSERGRWDRGRHSRRTGVLLVAVGIGLGFTNYFGTNDPLRVGRSLGIAALLALIGIAFLVNAMFDARSRSGSQPSPENQ